MNIFCRLRTIRLVKGLGRRYQSESKEVKHDYFGKEKEASDALGHWRFPNFHKFKLSRLTSYNVMNWTKRKQREYDIFKQKFIKKRHDTLGYNLASAHFIVYLKGAVKCFGKPDWIRADPKDSEANVLPDRYVKEFVLEGIDLSNTRICYEGLENMINLMHLKILILKNCPQVDDWFIDRVTRLFHDSLEYLDLSGCDNISERCLSCLYRCKKLKTLVLNNIVTDNSFELSCLLLEENMPGLTVHGVDYIKID